MSYRPQTDDVIVNGRLAKHRYDFYGADTVEASRIVHSGTAQSGSGVSVTLATSASSTDDAYNTYGFRTTGGTGSGQDRARITDYNGTTKVATLSVALETDLDSTTTYEIVNRGYA